MTEDTRAAVAKLISLRDLSDESRIIAECIGIEGLIRLSEKAGGTRVYVPKTETLIFQALPAIVRKEYNGYNVAWLARRWEISERTVRNYLEGKDAPPPEGQMCMTDY